MDYYGLLFLYYLKGLSGKSILRLFFNIEAGGTEQLLPENTSTPTTTPILADIQYPDGLRTDQYFTYRETPTTVSNKARIKTIKGNTLNWNQIYNVNSNRSSLGVNISVVNGVVSITGTSTGIGTSGPTFAWTDFKCVIGHKYIITKDFTLPDGDYIFDQYNLNSSIDITTIVLTATSTGEYIIPQLAVARTGVTYNISGHLCVYDVTKMFGQGNEPTSVEEFKSLFSLPYYAYNQGTLLSFNGNGIKTVGKNIFDFSQFANGTITFENGVLTGTAGQFYTAYSSVVNKGIDLKYPKNTQITISFDARTEQNDSPTGNGLYFTASENGSSVQLATTLNNTTAIQHKTITIPSDRHIDKLGWSYGSNPGNIWHITNFQIEFGTTETSYVPYTSSTLSLPISTYFSNGMKSAGNVYDELTESKAITRIGSVDLGSLNWIHRTEIGQGIFSCEVTSTVLYKRQPSVNFEVAQYNNGGTVTGVVAMVEEPDKTVCVYHTGNTNSRFIYAKNTAYSDATAFKNSLSGQYLVYELATPTETPITTEDANEALSLLMGKSVSSNNANQLINIITKGE